MIAFGNLVLCLLAHMHIVMASPRIRSWKFVAVALEFLELTNFLGFVGDQFDPWIKISIEAFARGAGSTLLD